MSCFTPELSQLLLDDLVRKMAVDHDGITFLRKAPRIRPDETSYKAIRRSLPRTRLSLFSNCSCNRIWRTWYRAVSLHTESDLGSALI